MSICHTETDRNDNGNTSGGKCMRPGRITTNGYLNYLREYRQKHCGLTAVETVRQGAREWNKLSPEEKLKYKMMGSSIKRTSRSNSRSRSRQRSKSPLRGDRMSRNSRMSSHGAKRRRLGRTNKSPRRTGKVSRHRTKHQSKAKSCMRPGRITNNGYLNFLRDYRKACCSMTPQETVRRGAQKWVSMSEQEKDKYRSKAFKIKQSRRPSKRASRSRC